MTGFWRTLAVGAMLGCASTSGAGWTEVTTPHFVVSTDLDREQAGAMSQSLEEMRAALLAVAWTGASDPRGRMNVVVFSQLKDFQHRVGNSMIQGIQINREWAEPMLSFNPDKGKGVPTVVVHELTHALSHWFMPVQPVWFAEGLAGYLEGTTFDHATKLASMGRMSERYTEWFKATRAMVRSSDMFAITTHEFDESRMMGGFYATSWLLVHYLLNEKADAFDGYQLALARLTPPREAWGNAFPELTPEELDAQVLAYTKIKRFHVRSVPVNVFEFSPVVRDLPPAEAHGVLAKLSVGLVPDVAEQEMQAALQLDPNELSALVVRFVQMEKAGDAARVELARRAVAAHPESAEAWLLVARSEPQEEAQRAALKRAHTLAPDHPAVAMLMARDEIDQGRAAAALPYTALALARSPLTPDLLALHVVALGARHQCAKAQSLVDSAEALFPESCQASTAGGKRVRCSALVRAAWKGVKDDCGAS